MVEAHKTNSCSNFKKMAIYFSQANHIFFFKADEESTAKYDFTIYFSPRQSIFKLWHVLNKVIPTNKSAMYLTLLPTKSRENARNWA